MLDASALRKYFKKPGLAAPIILGVLGLLFLAAYGLGLIFWAIAGAILYFNYANRPTDDQVDATMHAAMKDLRAAAISKLNLDEEEVNLVEPLLVSGYDYGSATALKKGKDGRWRANTVEGMVILFSDHEMHTYEKHVDLFNTAAKRESTGEYFYRDVVSIQTQSDQVSKLGYSVSYEELKITTSGGTSLSCNLFNTGAVASALNGARQLIKMKKRDS